MTRTQIIDRITEAVKPHDDIRALFLGGSYGNGRVDAFSDIDFIMVTTDGASDAIAKIWREAVAQTGEIVLWWDRTTVPVLINAITQDWTRTDLLILKPEQLRPYSQHALKPLFDKDGLYDSLAETAPTPAPNPGRLKYQFEEFIRVLGLLHLVVGREEYLNGVLGVHHLRNALVDLMILETNAPDRGGVLHLNRLITEEQKAALRAMPAAEPIHDALIAAHLAYAEAYLPRARKLAGRFGVDWPEAFEAATWARLEADLGIAKPEY